MFKRIDAQFAFTGKRTKNQEKTLRRLLNIDSRSGVYEGFQTPFFPINLSPDFGYEAPRRGPLLQSVIDSSQSSLTPLLSTGRSLTPIGNERVSSQYQYILGLLKIEV